MNKLIFIFLTLSCLYSARAQSGSGIFRVEQWGAGASMNSIADEAIIGLNLFAESHFLEWSHGNVYGGVSTYFGAFPDINQKFNQYISGRSILILPVQVIGGHEIHLIKKRMHLRTGLSFGPALLHQKITINDERFQINETYTYVLNGFTMHSKVGLGLSISNRNSLLLYANLPLINKRLAPLGAGLAFRRKI